MLVQHENKIKEFLRKNPESTKAKIAKGTGIWASTTCSVLDVLEAKKEVTVKRITERIHLVSLAHQKK